MLLDLGDAMKLFAEAFGHLELPPAFHPSYLEADVARGEGRDALFFCYREGAEVFFHGLLIGEIPGTGHCDISSPYGYGGPIATTGSRSFLERAWGAYRAWCRERRVLVEFIRFHPLAENWRYFDGDVFDDRETVWIDLTCDDLMLSYQTRVRTAIRKACRDGLTVERSGGESVIGEFRDLYLREMGRIGADPFYHFGEEYLRALLGVEGASLAVCRKGGDLLAAAIFLEGNGVLEYHLSASTETGRRHAATNLIIHEMALAARERGCRKLHLGGGGDGRTDHPLLFFKAGFSPRRGFFRIGRGIHDGELYRELQDAYRRRHGVSPARVLFYRDPEEA